MEKYYLTKNKVEFYNILFAITTPDDFEMLRYILLERLYDLKYNEYVIVEGYHCSCYDFDDSEYEAIKYTKDELITLAKKGLKEKYFDNTVYELYKFILNYFN